MKKRTILINAVFTLLLATTDAWSQAEQKTTDLTGEKLLPSGGTDRLDSEGTVELDLNCDGIPDLPPIDLRGPTQIQRSNPSLQGGLETVDTEMLQLDLRGLSPIGSVRVGLNPERPSRGQIREQDRGRGFPADSFFDVYFGIELADSRTNTKLELVNSEAVRMQATITEIPPRLTVYRSLTQPLVPLKLKGTERVVACLVHAAHFPNPPTPVRTEDLKRLIERVTLAVNRLETKIDAVTKTQKVGSSCILMFPFNVAGSGLETALAITNITKGLSLLGLGQESSGPIEFRLFPATPGTSSPGISSAELVRRGVGSGAGSDGNVRPGGTFLVLVGQLLESANLGDGFVGHIIATSGFPCEGTNVTINIESNNLSQGPAVHIR